MTSRAGMREAGWLRRRGLGLCAMAMALSALLAGCGEPSSVVNRNFAQIQSWRDFQRRVLRSPRPVLVEFNKDPCPTCIVQQKEIEQLIPEYRDRVLFASATIMEGLFVVTQPEIRDKYRVTWVPTTILFIKGEEVKRWELNHSAAEIRAELKKHVGEPRKPGALPPSRPFRF